MTSNTNCIPCELFDKASYFRAYVSGDPRFRIRTLENSSDCLTCRSALRASPGTVDSSVVVYHPESDSESSTGSNRIPNSQVIRPVSAGVLLASERQRASRPAMCGNALAQRVDFKAMYRGLDASRTIQSLISQDLPGFGPAAAEVRKELAAYNSTSSGSGRPGVGVLVMQTSNDFSDLLADVEMGRGRPAVRGLRSIFESLITILDITGPDSDAIDRYEDHCGVARYQAATMRAGLTGLTGNDLRSERHRRRKEQRLHRQAHDEALAKWGAQFKRSWASKSLRDRAVQHGYGDDYDLYRVASLPIHVSSGGMSGIERQYGDTSVFRFGHDLVDCPMAFNEGLRYFRLFVEALAVHTGFTAERVLQALSALESLRAEYRKVVRRIDESLWPSVAPIGGIVVRALLPDGRRKWILHDNDQRRIIECHPPKGAAEFQIRSAEDAIDEVEDTQRERDEWFTVAILGATADPLPDAKWRPDGFLVPVDWNPYGLILSWDQ